MAKDFGEFVLKGEAVHARATSSTPSSDGPQRAGAQDTMDYVVGVDIPAFNDGRVNCNIARRTADHDPPSARSVPRTGQHPAEHPAHAGLGGRGSAGVDAQAHRFHVPPEGDLVCRKNWRVTFGVDVFGGKPTGLFGRYSDRDGSIPRHAGPSRTQVVQFGPQYARRVFLGFFHADGQACTLSRVA
jgi:hypothetical protein